MDNQAYVETLGIDEEAQQTCLAVMERYGENHWWEPDVDPLKMAYCQLREPIFLMNDFSLYHKAIELLLGRRVWIHEFGSMGYEQLVQEANLALTQQVDLPPAAEREAASINLLVDWAKRNDKAVIGVQFSED